MTKNKNYNKSVAIHSYLTACSDVNPKCTDLEKHTVSFKGASIKQMQTMAKIWTKAAPEFGVKVTHVLNNIKEKTHEKQSEHNAEKGIEIGDGYER